MHVDKSQNNNKKLQKFTIPAHGPDRFSYFTVSHIVSRIWLWGFRGYRGSGYKYKIQVTTQQPSNPATHLQLKGVEEPAVACLLEQRLGLWVLEQLRGQRPAIQRRGHALSHLKEWREWGEGGKQSRVNTRRGRSRVNTRRGRSRVNTRRGHSRVNTRRGHSSKPASPQTPLPPNKHASYNGIIAAACRPRGVQRGVRSVAVHDLQEGGTAERASLVREEDLGGRPPTTVAGCARLPPRPRLLQALNHVYHHHLVLILAAKQAQAVTTRLRLHLR